MSKAIKEEEIEVHNVVDALKKTILERPEGWAPIPNNFFIEKIMHLHHWDSIMLDYILSCTYFRRTDSMGYSAKEVFRIKHEEGGLLGLPSKRGLQAQCIDRLAHLGLIKIEKKYKQPVLIQLNFFTFWVEEMAYQGYHLMENWEDIKEEQKLKHDTIGIMIPPNHDTRGVTIQEEEKKIVPSSAKASGDELFSKELDSMTEEQMDEAIVKVGLKLDAAIANRNNPEVFETPLTDAMTIETNTPQKRVADFLLLKRKTFIDNPSHNLEKWREDIEKAIRIDKRTEDQLMRLIKYIYSNDGKFWKPHIQSGASLRKKFETIEGQRKNSNPGGGTQRRKRNHLV